MEIKPAKAIAIDFDGTLCSFAYPDIGEPNWIVIHRARFEKERGARLILWTCRTGVLLDAAVEACKRWGLEFDAVNENLPERKAFYGNAPRKVGADEYWDDKAVAIDERGNFADRVFADVYVVYDEDGTRRQSCSWCQGDVSILYNYCPHCGAVLMSGGEVG